MTTNITLPRAAAQQALEALEDCGSLAAPALRAALAQQAEPVQEPAAKVELMMTGGNAGLATRIVEIDHHLRERLRPGQLLYTAPPQRKPLDDLAIADIYTKWDATPGVSMADFARAIERKVRGEEK